MTNTRETRIARATRERALGDWSWENNPRQRNRLIALVLTVKGTVCHLCGDPGATTADHKIPRSKGGRNTLDNCEPAHRDCNTARGTMSLTEWFSRHPRRRRQPLAPSREW